ncbi:MAG: hypothetical protein ACLP0J_23430 [Solirubrobacteraceae bacterium]
MAVVALAALVGGCGSSTPPPARTRKAPLLSIFEDEPLLRADPAHALATLQRLGADVVRVYVAWNAIAPDPDSAVEPSFDASNPASYPAGAWALYDGIVRDAAALKIRVYLTIGGGAPRWATGPGVPRHGHSKYADSWKPSAADFGQFVRALGVRYGGHYKPGAGSAVLPRVDFWSIWNEPSFGIYLAPQAIDHQRVEVSPRLYRGLLAAAWRALLATGHGPHSDTILIGETAPDGRTGPAFPGNFSQMVPLRFIRALYCVDDSFEPLRGTAATLRGCPASAAGSAQFEADNPALFEASGYADHPYESLGAPDNRSFDLPDDADFSELGNLELTLDRAGAAYGSRVKLPIYSTEFGYNASLLPPAQGAVYMNQAEYLSWRSPRIRSYDQYLLIDPIAGGFDTGLLSADGKPKATLAAYQMPLWLPVYSAAAGTPLEVWGCARPTPYWTRVTGRTQRVEIQFARVGTTAYRTLLTVTLTDRSSCYFDVKVTPPASGEVRLTWRGEGQRFFSRLQAITLH